MNKTHLAETTPGGVPSTGLDSLPSSEISSAQPGGGQTLLANNETYPKLNAAKVNDEELSYHGRKTLTQRVLHKDVITYRHRSYSCGNDLSTNEKTRETTDSTDGGSTGSTIETRGPSDKVNNSSTVGIVQAQNAAELWQDGQVTKRTRESPENARINLKQAKLSSYLLRAPVLTNNRFSALDVEVATPQVSAQEARLIKPPPLFIDDVANIQPLTKLLNEVANAEYELKVLNGSQIKVLLKNIQAYTIIT